MSRKQRSELISCIFAESRLRDVFPRGGFAASLYLVANGFSPTQKLRGGFGNYINEEKLYNRGEKIYHCCLIYFRVCIPPDMFNIRMYTGRSVCTLFPPSFAGSQREFEKLPSSRPRFQPPPTQPMGQRSWSGMPQPVPRRHPSAAPHCGPRGSAAASPPAGKTARGAPVRLIFIGIEGHGERGSL